MKLKFSANLGFLWNDRPLPEAIRAAAAAGFDAVEIHWPYAEDAAAIGAALTQTGLPMLGLNTARGDAAAGEVGRAALPGRAADARGDIDQALDWAARIGARSVHVMAGRARGPAAEAAFLESLDYAARAAPEGVTLLIEPLNPRDAPGYFLNAADQAAAIIATLDTPKIRLMFDCYHVQIVSGDLLRRCERLLPLIGHVQFAAAPSRAEPDEGEIAYDRLLPAIAALGYDGFFGAEYRPRAGVEAGLGWLKAFRAAAGRAAI